jgi:hypothetical protein
MRRLDDPPATFLPFFAFGVELFIMFYSSVKAGSFFFLAFACPGLFFTFFALS